MGLGGTPLSPGRSTPYHLGPRFSGSLGLTKEPKKKKCKKGTTEQPSNSLLQSVKRCGYFRVT